MFLQFILPLAAPVLLYLLWSWATRPRSGEQDQEPAFIREGPWFWLILAGVALMLTGLAVATITSGMDPNGQYRAPYLQDGKVMPGSMVEKP